MKIAIIGPGLIGGSFALALKQKRYPPEIIGWDHSGSNLKEALSLGIVDHMAHSLSEAVDQAEQIYLSVPVNAIEQLLPRILDQLTLDQSVIDFGSTKQHITEMVKDHPKRAQYIAAHPIAGTEYSGPAAAFPGLFKEKTMIICDRELSDHELCQSFEKLCREIGMHMAYLTSKDHDRHLAYVSHLSHAIAFGLSNTVLEEEKGDNKILELAGSGFASTVRLAKSSPEMWTPIFMKNQKYILEGLDRYLAEMERIRHLIAENKNDLLTEYLEQGRLIRKILE
jgi:prephenate dehydrogenase